MPKHPDVGISKEELARTVTRELADLIWKLGPGPRSRFLAFVHLVESPADIEAALKIDHEGMRITLLQPCFKADADESHVQWAQDPVSADVKPEAGSGPD